ncbi:hypothetical protein HNR43_002700 [Anoxybacillus mongoliensis]|uniref:YokE-like PH domain-containing protein n=1 Tax=Anoxybacillus mongoliensis TaxID=452565 RepID=A0A7W8JJ72_9BACL|nr:PH domain-containing protein [Anoxybacillus mongoliensis]MBB5356688.1 hypothetical protein [Anoxybacillus mongoliensis]
MSFFKKLLGITDMTEEEKAALQKKQQEKERKIAEKERRANEKKQKELALQEKYIGTGFGKSFSFAIYKPTIQYFEDFVLRHDENVLHSIPAEYDKTKKREIKGLLIATDQRLVFVSSGVGYGQFFEEFDYKKINGIAHANDGLLEKEIYIDMGRSRKKFDDITPDERFKNFVSIVMDQIHTARNTSRTITKKTSSTHSTEKYELLEKISKLKEQGILTEEEFQREKEKILNS